MRKNSWIIFVVLNIFFLFVVNFYPSIVNLIPQDSNTTTNKDPSIKADLNTLLSENVVLSANFLIALYSDKNTNKTQADLEKNSKSLSGQFSKIGVDGKQFLSAWNANIKSLADYTIALKNKDENEKNRLKQDLRIKELEISYLISKAIPAVSLSQTSKLMQDHDDMILSIVEAYSKGNSGEQISQMSKAQDHASQFANTLSDAISK